MTKDEFKAAQAKLGMTNAKTAEKLRVSLRCVEYYRAGGRKIPGPVVAILGMLEKEGKR